MNNCRRRDCGAELPHGYKHTWCRRCLREYHQERRAVAAEAREQQRLAQLDLYVIHNPSSGLVKVGRSADVRRRLNALQSSAGQVMELVKQFERKGLCEPACHEKLSPWHVPPGREWFSASPEQVLQIVEQVVREAQELSDEEEEEESTSEETSLPEAQRTPPAAPEPAETLQMKREAVALAELEAQAMRARVQVAADVARLALHTLRELGLCVSDHDLLLAKNMITEAAFGAQSGTLGEPAA